MKKIVGITGGIGSGKSLVSGLFKELGATVVDADKIARDILEPFGRAYVDVVETFGKDILKEDGNIDRKKLAAIVFADPEKLERLNQLTHPAVFEVMANEIDSANTNLVCLDVPLLFTCEFPIFCHKTLAVIAPDELRVQRVMKRDGCTREEAEARMKRQLSNHEFQEKADICIQNDTDEKLLRERVKEIHAQLMEML